MVLERRVDGSGVARDIGKLDAIFLSPRGSLCDSEII